MANNTPPSTQPGQAPVPLRVKLAAWLIVALVTLVAIEVLARVIFPYPEIRNFDRAKYSPQMVSGPLLSQTSLAHASYTIDSAPDNAQTVHRLNLYGFRDREWQVKKRAVKRLLVVGDSMVEGFLAQEDETVPRVLEKLAHGAGEDVEVWNLGVGGSSLYQYLPLIQDAVRAFSPDEIVLVLHANDLLGGPTFSQDLVVPPFVADRGRPWIPRVLSVALRVSRHQAVPRRWHQAPFPFFAAVPNPGNPWTQHGEDYARNVEPDIAQAMREGRFNPFNVGEVFGYEYFLRQPVNIRPWLDFLSTFMKEHHVKWSLAYVPQPAQVSDHYQQYKQRYNPPGVPSLKGEAYQQGPAHLSAEAAALGIPFVDMSPIFKAKEDQGDHLYWDYDEHLRPAGYALVAKTLQDLRQGGARKTP